jgi:hypothetical protein
MPLRSARLVLTLALALLLSGCATFRSYDKELGQTLGQVSSGNVDGAIKVLESNNKSDTKDLLYYFELGELLRLRIAIRRASSRGARPTQPCSAGKTRPKRIRPP